VSYCPPLRTSVARQRQSCLKAHGPRATKQPRPMAVTAAPARYPSPSSAASHNRGISECRGYHGQGCRSFLGADEFLDSAGGEWVLGSIFAPPWRGRAMCAIGTMRCES
jgi:hypothetical protein